MTPKDLTDSVGQFQGKACPNRPADVCMVKELLNLHAMKIKLTPPLTPSDPTCGPKTCKAIEDFQRIVMGKGPPYGRVSPSRLGGQTLKALQNTPATRRVTKFKVAPSANSALSQATQKWPKRSRASDGTIGDAAHSHRKSDHNPDAEGVVHAFDLTHDPVNGVDCEKLATHLVKRRDVRVKYIIWNHRICNANTWAWRAYSGTNPHSKHMHVSIKDSDAAETDTSPWWG